MDAYLVDEVVPHVNLDMDERRAKEEARASALVDADLLKHRSHIVDSGRVEEHADASLAHRQRRIKRKTQLGGGSPHPIAGKLADLPST